MPRSPSVASACSARGGQANVLGVAIEQPRCPNSSSSEAMRLEMAAWVMLRRSAASRKLPSRTAQTKASRKRVFISRSSAGLRVQRACSNRHRSRGREIALRDHRQHIDIISVPQAAPQHGVCQLHLEARRRANAADCTERATIHGCAGREVVAARVLADEIAWRSQTGERSLLIEVTLPVDRCPRAQDEFVPMSFDLIIEPELLADRLAAQLL